MSTDLFIRLKRFDDQYLPFPAFAAARDRIERHMRQYREVGLVTHMLILGEPGTGKSSLCRWMQTCHPRRRRTEGDQVPILVVSIPPGATLVGIADAVLEALGDSVAGRSTVAAKTAAIVTLCRNVGVMLLMLDEAQHFNDRGATRTHYLAGDWLKHLLDQLGIPVVLLGLPRMLELLQTNEQLRRRITVQQRLELGQSGKFTIEEECLQLFLSLASLVGLPVVLEPFGALEMGQRLHLASDGRVAYIKRLLMSSLQLAHEEQLPTIAPATLGRAYNFDVWHGAVGPLNPFDDNFVFRRLDRSGEPFETPYMARRSGS